MRLYILSLNDMRSPQVEILNQIARAEAAEQLIQLMERESVEFYRDGHWGKAYRKGGPLEWYNPPFENPIRLVDTDEYLRRLESTLLSIPKVDAL